MYEIMDEPWMTCFFPCGKTVLKEEGASLQPISFPLPVLVLELVLTGELPMTALTQEGANCLSDSGTSQV